MNTEKTEKIAKSLFIRISDFIAKTIIERKAWPKDVKGKNILLIKLSTNEKYPESDSWKGIFYLHFYYDKEYKPIPVGIGSLTKNELTVDSEIVPEEIRKLFNNFSFGVIASNMTFEQMKNEILPYYQQLEAE